MLSSCTRTKKYCLQAIIHGDSTTLPSEGRGVKLAFPFPFSSAVQGVPLPEARDGPATLSFFTLLCSREEAASQFESRSRRFVERSA